MFIHMEEERTWKRNKHRREISDGTKTKKGIHNMKAGNDLIFIESPSVVSAACQKAHI